MTKESVRSPSAMSKLPKVANPSRRLYPSDLSDVEWERIKPLLPGAKGFGRKRTVDLREILNGVFYVQRSGCQWEMMPHDLPPHSTVYKYFQKWQRKGIWQEIHDHLREELRKLDGREPQSSVAIADSQSVKTTEKRGSCTDLMGENLSRVVNVISSLIPKDCSSGYS